jgi:hypothetical protein
LLPLDTEIANDENSEIPAALRRSARRPAQLLAESGRDNSQHTAM